MARIRRKELCAYRVMDLTFDQANKFVAEFPSLSFEAHENRRNKGVYSVSFLLKSNIDKEALSGAVGLAKELKVYYGFFISLCTERDSDLMAVPKYVVKLIQRHGGHLVFSFTC